MAVTVDLPSDMEKRLRSECADLDSEAKEAVLVELYRQQRLSHYELAQALGLDRFEADGVLKRHGVTIDLPTAAEVDAELRHLRGLVGK